MFIEVTHTDNTYLSANWQRLNISLLFHFLYESLLSCYYSHMLLTNVKFRHSSFCVDYSDFPCDVDLSESVEYLVKPTTFTNFAKLSLQYIEKEDNYSSDPRFAGHQKVDER